MNSKPPHGNPHHPGPTSFKDIPGGMNPRSVQAQPMRQVSVPPAPVQPPPHKRTHQTEARVTVRLPNTIEMNRQALQALRVSAAGKFNEASAIDIIPPRRGASTQWLLDTRPEATGRVFEKRGTWFFKSAAHIDPNYFRQVSGPPRSRRQFAIGPELQHTVCVTLPNGKQVCEQQGNGVFLLLPV